MAWPSLFGSMLKQLPELQAGPLKQEEGNELELQDIVSHHVGAGK